MTTPLMVQEGGPDKWERRSGVASSEGAFIWPGGGGGGGIRVCAVSAHETAKSREAVARRRDLEGIRII
jgi:hypothetical protein